MGKSKAPPKPKSPLRKPKMSGVTRITKKKK